MLALYGGYNFQVSPRWVIGVEADFAYANETAVFHGSPYPANLIFGLPGQPGIPFGASYSDEFKVTTGWDASARVRGGWLANPTTLIYMTAGLAWANLSVVSTCSTTPTPNVKNCAPGNYFGGTLGPATVSHSGIQLGWTAGTGVEMMLTHQLDGPRQLSFRRFRLSVVRPVQAVQLLRDANLHRLPGGREPAHGHLRAAADAAPFRGRRRLQVLISPP